MDTHMSKNQRPVFACSLFSHLPFRYQRGDVEALEYLQQVVEYEVLFRGHKVFLHKFEEICQQVEDFLFCLPNVLCRWEVAEHL